MDAKKEGRKGKDMQFTQYGDKTAETARLIPKLMYCYPLYTLPLLDDHLTLHIHVEFAIAKILLHFRDSANNLIFCF